MEEESLEVTPTERDGQLNRDCDVASTPSEEELAVFYGSESAMGGVEERASSSLSTSSAKASRIPRLSRSGSLRERSHNRLSLDCLANPVSRNSPPETGKQTHRNVPNIGGLFRSSSFVTSRGITDFPSPGVSCGRSSTPLTPELQRRNFHLPLSTSYVSPYSKRAIAAERKSQSHAGVSTLRDKEAALISPQIFRRASQPLNPTHTSNTAHTPVNYAGGNPLKVATTPEDEDDNISEKSFGSVSSAHSCDVVTGLRKIGGGFWGSSGRRSRNVLHCTHAHNQHTEDYQTPTQRAARKIRELQAELKNARQEVFEKEVKISALTRDLVELRMNKAGSERRDHNRGIEASKITKKEIKRKVSGSFSPSTSPTGASPSPTYFRPCLTPTSDDSEQELKLFARKRECSRSKCSNKGESSPKRGNETISPRHSPTVASVGGDSDSGELSRSLADSGHYEDLPSPCLSSRDSLDTGFPSIRKLLSTIYSSDGGERENAMIWAAMGAAEEGLRVEWARKIEELKANHMEEYHEMKERHNDKVEMLLSKLSDANLKYFELRPQHDKSQDRVRELEREVDRLRDEVRDSEIRHQKVYLQMYLKGQQAAKTETEDKFPVSTSSCSEDATTQNLPASGTREKDAKKQSSMIFGLMKQLAQSEDEIQSLRISQSQERRGRSSFSSSRREEIDPEVTLQFLKSAIYYFLTDRDHSPGHLRVIESILGYSTLERGNISRSSRL